VSHPGLRYVKLACQRFLDRQGRWRTPARKWEFRDDIAERAFRIAGLLPNIKGPAGRQAALR
jgi:hypothetical protein